jgi:transcriptional regulator with XRE-family HTH domain
MGGVPESAEAILGAHVRHLRQSHGWTQQDLARKLESVGFSLHQSAIARIEAGTRPVRLNEAVALTTVLSVDLSKLLRSPLTQEMISDLERDLNETRGRTIEAHQRVQLIEAVIEERQASLLAARVDVEEARGQLARWHGRLAALEARLDDVRSQMGQAAEADV